MNAPPAPQPLNEHELAEYIVEWLRNRNGGELDDAFREHARRRLREPARRARPHLEVQGPAQLGHPRGEEAMKRLIVDVAKLMLIRTRIGLQQVDRAVVRLEIAELRQRGKMWLQ